MIRLAVCVVVICFFASAIPSALRHRDARITEDALGFGVTVASRFGVVFFPDVGVGRSANRITEWMGLPVPPQLVGDNPGAMGVDYGGAGSVSGGVSPLRDAPAAPAVTEASPTVSGAVSALAQFVQAALATFIEGILLGVVLLVVTLVLALIGRFLESFARAVPPRIVKALFKKPDFASSSAIRQHCIAHTVVSATPSFVLALCTYWNHVPQILGMVVGVVLFILCAERVHRLARVRALMTRGSFGAVLHGTKVARLVLCLFGMSFFFLNWLHPPFIYIIEGSIFFYIIQAYVFPDLLVGSKSVLIVRDLSEYVLQQNRAEMATWSTPVKFAELNPPSQFTQALLVTVIEGLLLSALLLLFALLFWLVWMGVWYARAGLVSVWRSSFPK
jgi:hypothetical protein